MGQKTLQACKTMMLNRYDFQLTVYARLQQHIVSLFSCIVCLLLCTLFINSVCLTYLKPCFCQITRSHTGLELAILLPSPPRVLRWQACATVLSFVPYFHYFPDDDISLHMCFIWFLICALNFSYQLLNIFLKIQFFHYKIC